MVQPDTGRYEEEKKSNGKKLKGKVCGKKEEMGELSSID